MSLFHSQTLKRAVSQVKLKELELDEKIKKYYEENQVLYNLFWMNRENLSMNYGFWDKDTGNLNAALLNQNRVVAERLDIKDSDVVLDAGCGVGGTGIWLARSYGVKITGITLSEKQAKLARKNAANRGVEHLVKFYVKDFTDTGFPDNSFTKIFGIESICHAERKEDFMREAFRLLRPGGRLVICDGFLNKADLDETEQRIYSDWLNGWVVPNLSAVNDFKESLRRSGFKDIGFTDKTKEVEPSSKKIYIRGVVGYPLIKLLNLLNLTSEAQVNHAKSCIKQYQIIGDRIGIYGIFSARK